MAKPTATAKRRVVRDRSPVALLLIDVINDLEFPGGEKLAARLPPFIRQLSRLKQRARQAGIAVVYVNDNFGRWRSDQHKIVEHCGSERMRGSSMVRRLRPTHRDYFVLKPRHSGFHSSALGTLLEYLETSTVIITGITGDNCVLFTTADAYMLNFRVCVPADCTISQSEEANRQALELMRRELKVDTTASDELDLRREIRQARR